MTKLSTLKNRLKKANEMLSHTMFEQYDFNEDQMIGRDEWEGTDDVFSLLDTNKDEYLDSDEIGYGVGQSFARQASDEEYLTPQEIADIMGGTLVSVKPAKTAKMMFDRSTTLEEHIINLLTGEMGTLQTRRQNITLKQVTDILNVSPAVALDALDNLVEKGLIDEWAPKKYSKGENLRFAKKRK